MKKIHQLALMMAAIGAPFESFIPKAPEPREETEADREAIRKAEEKRARRAAKKARSG